MRLDEQMRLPGSKSLGEQMKVAGRAWPICPTSCGDDPGQGCNGEQERHNHGACEVYAPTDSTASRFGRRYSFVSAQPEDSPIQRPLQRPKRKPKQPAKVRRNRREDACAKQEPARRSPLGIMFDPQPVGPYGHDDHAKTCGGNQISQDSLPANRRHRPFLAISRRRFIVLASVSSMPRCHRAGNALRQRLLPGRL